MTAAAFFFSALFAALLSPLGLYLGGAALLLALPERSVRRRRALAALTALFAFSCTDFCGKTLLSALEGLAADCPAPDPAKPAVFVVLGGGAVAEGDIYQPSIASQRRMRRARNLVSEHPGSKLLLSGIESRVMAHWLGDVPYLLETRSLNTRSNIRESAKLLRRTYPDAKTRPAVCIVTDRFHTPRALRCARDEMRDFAVTAAPAPSLVRHSGWRLFHFIPTGSGLAVTSMAWRETLALLRDVLCRR